MRLIRTAFLIGCGIMLLPTDPQRQAQVFASAKSAAHWTMTFCDRNADTCVQGKRTWALFEEKAAFGAKVAFDLISERANALTTPSRPVADRPSAEKPALLPHGGLQPADLKPAWQGNSPRRSS